MAKLNTLAPSWETQHRIAEIITECPIYYNIKKSPCFRRQFARVLRVLKVVYSDNNHRLGSVRKKKGRYPDLACCVSHADSPDKDWKGGDRSRKRLLKYLCGANITDTTGFVYTGFIYAGFVYTGFVCSGFVCSGFVCFGFVYTGFVHTGFVYTGLVYTGFVCSGLVYTGLVYTGFMCARSEITQVGLPWSNQVVLCFRRYSPMVMPNSFLNSCPRWFTFSNPNDRAISPSERSVSSIN